jgi:hypothetical protein
MKGIVKLDQFGYVLNLYGSDGKLSDVFALEDLRVDTVYGAVTMQTLIDVMNLLETMLQTLEIERR